MYGSRGTQEIDLDELTFKLVVRSRDKGDVTVPPYTVTLMAPSAQEKAAWTSDISQVPNINVQLIKDCCIWWLIKITSCPMSFPYYLSQSELPGIIINWFGKHSI